MLADVCVIAIVAIFIYMGYRSGFLKAFIKIASYIIAIVISAFLYPVLSDLLIKTPLYGRLTEMINEKYIAGNLTESVNDTMGILTRYISVDVQSAAMGLAERIAAMLISIIAFIAILILSKIMIRIVSKIFNIFTKLPVIKQFNRLGGAILGGASGVLVLYIICAAMVLFSPLDQGGKVISEIEESVFASEIYENNIILNYIGKGN